MKYNTLVIDPPWPMTMTGKFGRRPNRAQSLPYPSMTLEEIKNFPIGDYANEGAHIYLWATNKFLIDESENNPKLKALFLKCAEMPEEKQADTLKLIKLMVGIL